MTSVQNPRLDYVFSLENTHPPSFRAFHPDGGTGTQPPPTIPGKLTRSQDPCPSAVKERYTAAMAQRGPFFCHGRNSCTFPVNRFRVSAQFSAVFAQFSAVCTVPDALGVDGTRFTFSPRLTVFAFPTTVLPSFQLFSPSFQLFAPFRTRWAFTAHVPRFSPRFTVSAFPFTFSPSFHLFSQFRTCWALTGHVPSDFVPVTVFVFPSTFSPTFQLFAPFRTRWALTGHVPSDFVPVNRFRVTVHVFAQFSAVCTVPDALGVYGTRSTFSPRLTDFAFPSTFSPSFQLFAPFRTRWAFTAHVFCPGSRFSRFRPRFRPG